MASGQPAINGVGFFNDRAGVPFSIRDVLNHLGEPVRPPAVHPARGPPELEFDFAEPSADGMDQTPAVDPADPEPIPDRASRGANEMDQTRSW